MSKKQRAQSAPPTVADLTRPVTPRPVRYQAELAVSAHDRVSSFIVAMLYMVGFIVLLMFLLWLTTRASSATAPLAVEYLDDLAGAEAAVGEGRDFEQPGVDDIQDLATPDAQELLNAVTDAASSLQASSDTMVGDVSQGQGGGDRRRAGAGGNAAVPRWERWEVQFMATGLSQYAQQLAAFNIELAAVGGGQDEVDYASNLTNSRPSRRTAPAAREQRLYMSYRRGQLREFDRQLLQKAGIRTEGRTLLQFYPQRVQNTLAALEQRAAGGRPLRDIRRTVFAVRKSGNQFSFEVVDQQYR